MAEAGQKLDLTNPGIRHELERLINSDIGERLGRSRKGSVLGFFPTKDDLVHVNGNETDDDLLALNPKLYLYRLALKSQALDEAEFETLESERKAAEYAEEYKSRKKADFDDLSKKAEGHWDRYQGSSSSAVFFDQNDGSFLGNFAEGEGFQLTRALRERHKETGILKYLGVLDDIVNEPGILDNLIKFVASQENKFPYQDYGGRVRREYLGKGEPAKWEAHLKERLMVEVAANCLTIFRLAHEVDPKTLADDRGIAIQKRVLEIVGQGQALVMLANKLESPTELQQLFKAGLDQYFADIKLLTYPDETIEAYIQRSELGPQLRARLAKIKQDLHNPNKEKFEFLVKKFKDKDKDINRLGQIAAAADDDYKQHSEKREAAAQAQVAERQRRIDSIKSDIGATKSNLQFLDDLIPSLNAQTLAIRELVNQDRINDYAEVVDEVDRGVPVCHVRLKLTTEDLDKDIQKQKDALQSQADPVERGKIIADLETLEVQKQFVTALGPHLIRINAEKYRSSVRHKERFKKDVVAPGISYRAFDDLGDAPYFDPETNVNRQIGDLFNQKDEIIDKRKRPEDAYTREKRLSLSNAQKEYQELVQSLNEHPDDDNFLLENEAKIRAFKTMIDDHIALLGGTTDTVNASLREALKMQVKHFAKYNFRILVDYANIPGTKTQGRMGSD